MVQKFFFLIFLTRAKSVKSCAMITKNLTTLIWFDSLSTDVKVLDFAWGTQAN